MKASDLRIGNIVGTPIGISRVLEVSELWIYAEPINYDGGGKIIELSKVKPIDISDEILERFSFNVTWCKEPEWQGTKECMFDEFYNFYWFNNQVFFGSYNLCCEGLTYMHQLQNLYSVVLHKELIDETTK